MRNNLKIILVGIIFLSLPFFAQAENIEFNIDPSYDSLGRSKVSAFLYQVGENALFYLEEDYYKKLSIEEIEKISESLKNLSQEFDNVIYPDLRRFYGSEWKPGIDKDTKITVLLTQIKEEAGGYFNQGDEYYKAQVPSSNEREMVYFNVKYVTSPLAKSYLAHEFTHLISFEQKERTYDVSEEIWLNEARAELAPTLLGYDETYEGSNLQKRVRIFAQKPEDSLTEWKNTNFDYGVLNVFFQYLLDHYGTAILKDSLASSKTGIESLNYALKKNAFFEDFSQIFTNWTIAVLINDCTFGPQYCYLNENLSHVRALPNLNYLPLTGEISLSLADYTKNWSGNWYKFIGGQGTLKLEFKGEKNVKFKVPYLTRDALANYSVSFLNLDSANSGTVYIEGFGDNYKSFIIIPTIQDKISEFSSNEKFYSFSWTASIISSNSSKAEEKLIQELLLQIEYLKKEIARLQTQINAILTKKELSSFSCQKLENNLYYGMTNKEVSCLQEFLKSQGSEIYPEGLITGNFLSLTKAAVIRFQEKYKSEILTPLALERGTGFVGFSTRSKINQLLGK